MRSFILIHGLLSVHTLHSLFIMLSRPLLLLASRPSPVLCAFEWQVLLNPVIAISDDEMKATQPLWGQNICFPPLSPSGPHNLISIDFPIWAIPVATVGLAVMQFQFGQQW